MFQSNFDTVSTASLHNIHTISRSAGRTVKVSQFDLGLLGLLVQVFAGWVDGLAGVRLAEAGVAVDGSAPCAVLTDVELHSHVLLVALGGRQRGDGGRRRGLLCEVAHRLFCTDDR